MKPKKIADQLSHLAAALENGSIASGEAAQEIKALIDSLAKLPARRGRPIGSRTRPQTHGMARALQYAELLDQNIPSAEAFSIVAAEWGVSISAVRKDFDRHCDDIFEPKRAELRQREANLMRDVLMANPFTADLLDMYRATWDEYIAGIRADSPLIADKFTSFYPLFEESLLVSLYGFIEENLARKRNGLPLLDLLEFIRAEPFTLAKEMFIEHVAPPKFGKNRFSRSIFEKLDT